MSEALQGVLLGGIIGIGATLIGAFADSWFRRGERKADVREKRRAAAAQQVGPVIAVLRDLEPNANVGVLRGNPRAREALQEKWAAWLSAQGGLEILAATHPDSEVERLCEVVIEEGTSLLGRLHLAITDGRAQSEEWWTETTALRDRAMTTARSLVREVLNQPA